MSSPSPSKSAGSPLLQSLKRRDTVGEIHSRFLDPRPFIQGEKRYFIKEFEGKRGHREMRVLGNLHNSISETKEQTLPKCVGLMYDQLASVQKTLEGANHSFNRLQQREQENLKVNMAKKSHETLRAHWDIFMKEQAQRRIAIDLKSTAKQCCVLKEQYNEQYISFSFFFFVNKSFFI
uniref:Biogenesis of lysosome-related organelles complex 1 subunit 5 n=1 Tax=Leptobrachium leishanense TaxID=445787 RepID=A0A8C5PJL3_9ANUR